MSGRRREVGPSGWRAVEALFYLFLEVGWVCMGVKEETVTVFISVVWFTDFHLQFAKHSPSPETHPRTQEKMNTDTTVSTKRQRSVTQDISTHWWSNSLCRILHSLSFCFLFGHLSSIVVISLLLFILILIFHSKAPLAAELCASCQVGAWLSQFPKHTSCYTLSLLLTWKIAFGLEKELLNLEPKLSKLHFDEALCLLDKSNLTRNEILD